MAGYSLNNVKDVLLGVSSMQYLVTGTGFARHL